MPWSVENEDLIREVRGRASLYDHSLHTDRAAREKLWLEVCESLCPEDFHEITDEERDNRVKDIRKKWRNLRDCFTKDLNHRSNRCLGRRKRRKYLYYEDLLFLAPFVQPGEKTTSTSRKQNSTVSDNSAPITAFKQENNSDEDTNSDSNIAEDSDQPYSMVSISTTGNNCATRNASTGGGVDPTALLQVEEDIDEDKSFLLSLVPAFRRFSQKQKLAAKIEMLQVIQKVSFPEE